MSKTVLSTFSSRNFIGSGLTFKSLNQFEFFFFFLILFYFYIWYLRMFCFHYFTISCPIFSAPLTVETVFYIVSFVSLS